MSVPSQSGAYDLTHQQSDVLEYITEIAQELAQMAERAGCSPLSHDLRQAILRAHGDSDNAPVEGITSTGMMGAQAIRKRL